MPVYLKLLGDEQRTEAKIDWLGGGLLALSVAQILLAVTLNAGWLLGGLLTGVCFIIRIRHAEHPFVRTVLFQNREYSFYLIMAFVVTGMGYALFFTTPLFLSEVHALEASVIGLAMVPAAVVTAILNRQGGKLADKNGPSALFYTASALMFTCFFLLSTLMGSTVWLIVCLLVLGYVGQSFMSIVMSRTISLTLPAEQAGVGMGLLMMQNFIAGSIAMGIYSKVLDVGATRTWNPVSSSLAGVIYSNLFFTLAILCAVVVIVFRFQLHRKPRDNQLKKEV